MSLIGLILVLNVRVMRFSYCGYDDVCRRIHLFDEADNDDDDNDDL